MECAERKIDTSGWRERFRLHTKDGCESGSRGGREGGSFLHGVTKMEGAVAAGVCRVIVYCYNVGGLIRIHLRHIRRDVGCLVLPLERMMALLYSIERRRTDLSLKYTNLESGRKKATFTGGFGTLYSLRFNSQLSRRKHVGEGRACHGR